MHLIYVDEAGSAPDQAIHIAAAVIIRDKQWRTVEAKLEAIARKYVSPKKRESFELHAHEIYQGHGFFARRKKSVRDKILNQVLGIMTGLNLPIVYAGVHKARLKKKYVDPYDPAELSFLLLAERVERWFVQNAREDVGMFIADETKAKAEIKKSLRQYRKSGIPLGIRDEKLQHIIETIHVADSKESCGIQLADFCAYFIKRHEMGKKDRERIYKRLSPFIWDRKMFP